MSEDKPPINDNKPIDTPENQSDKIQVITGEKSLKSYWIFFSGQLFSLLGSSIVQFALIWWITLTSQANYPDKTGLILGLASVLGFAPFVITSLFAGVFVDRWNRKYVIAIADFSQAFVTGILMILFYIDQATLPFVLGLLALRAVAQGFHSPATQAIIPLLVPREKLTQVNSIEFLFNGLIFLVGPVIGAVLIEWLGVDQMGTILWADVITFATAIIPVMLIHIPDITKKKRESKDKPSFSEEFKEGIGFIQEKDGLLSLLITFTITNIVTAPLMVLLPLVVINPDLINGNAQTLAIYMALSQVGSIGSALVLSKWQIFRRNVDGVVFGQAIMYITMIGVALSAYTGNMSGLWISGFVNGISMPISNIHSQTIWQSVVPPELQGRVMSVRMVIAWIFIPVAQLVGGYLSDIIGSVNVFYLGSLIGGIFLSYAWFMTDLPNVEKRLGLDTDVEIIPTEDENITPS